MTLITSATGRRLVTLLRARGALSRTQLGAALNVQPSTITRLVDQLLAQGLLLEEVDPARKGQRGFPAKRLSLRPESFLSAGVFVDPGTLFTCIVDSTGTLLSETEQPIIDRDFTSVFTMAGQSVARQLSDLSLTAENFIGCGISYPGQHTNKPGKVLRTTYLADWPDIDARTDLEPFFHMPVHQLNDAKAACLAELLFGACKQIPNFCYIWISYGIGGGAVIDQELYNGRDMSAAEYGGLFPKSGPRPSGQDLLNTLAANGHTFTRLEDVPAEVLEGQTVAAWVARATEQLRWLSLVIMRTFAPQAIVLGGRLPNPILDLLHAALVKTENLGEDYRLDMPLFLRAQADGKPQLGAAALPIYLGSKIN